MSSGGGEEGEEAAGRAAGDANDTHPLLPGAKTDSSPDDDVLWCDTCDKPVAVGTKGITAGKSTCPKCRQQLKPVESSKDLPIAADFLQLKCPLTKCFFKEPVVAPGGQNYEQDKIEQYIETHHKHPVTGGELKTGDLIPNNSLKEFMKVFKEGKWVLGSGKATPSCLKCSLSKKLFQNPVIAPSGCSYEKTLIEEHLKQHHKEPNMRKVVYSEQLIPNSPLKFAVDQYQLQVNERKGQQNTARTQPQKDPLDFSRPTTDLLQTPPTSRFDGSKTVRFHALLPQDVWSCGDKTPPRVRIRFGHPQLGNWKDCIELTIERPEAEGLVMMQGQVHIPAILGRSPIPYKYVVYSSRANLNQQPHEYLHESTHGDANRCLQIPRDLLQEGDIYNKYDTIVYPPHPTRSFWDMVRFWKSSPVDFKPKDSVQMRQECLHQYLEPFVSKVCSEELLPNYNIVLFSEQILNVHSQMRQLHVHKDGVHHIVAKAEPEVNKAMKQWIVESTNHLRVISNPNKRFLSAVTLLYIIKSLAKSYYLHLDSLQTEIGFLLKFLVAEVDLSSTTVPGYQLILTATEQDSRKSVAQCLWDVLQHRLQICSPLHSTWICVLPYYHFLSRLCQPFDKLEPSEAWSLHDKEHSGGLKNASRAQITADKKFPHGHYFTTELKIKEDLRGAVQRFNFLNETGLFKADPVLLPVLLSVCPESCYVHLVGLIPPHFAMSWLSRLMNNPESTWSTWGGFTYIKKVHLDMLGKVRTHLTNENHDTHEYQAALEESKSLLGNIVKLLTKDELHIQVLKGAICLVLLAVTKSVSDSSDVNSLRRNPAFATIQKCVRDWIKNSKVVGGTRFGGAHGKRTVTEIQLWESITEVGSECLPQVKKSWESIVLEPIMKERVDQLIRAEEKVEILCKMGVDESVLSDVVTQAAMQEIPDLMKKDGGQCLKQLRSVNSSNSGRIFGLVLERHLKDIPSLAFSDLLEWELWPFFFEIEAKQSIIFHGLPLSAKESCKRALKIFADMNSSIHSGEITAEVLHEVLQNADAFDTIARLTQNSSQCIDSVLQQYKYQLQCFETQKKQLAAVCSMLPDDVQGIREVQKKLQMNHYSSKLSELCAKRYGQPLFSFFESAEPLQPMLSGFYTMNVEHCNDFFSKEWNRQMKAVEKSDVPLTFEDVHNVWDRAFSHCKQIYIELEGQSMKLSDVNSHFRQYETAELQYNLNRLVTGISKCLGEHKPTEFIDAWVQKTVALMQDHWSLKKYAEAAYLFIQLKINFGLMGTFTSVEHLHSTVTTSQENSVLKDVSRTVVQAGKSLEETANNDKRLECLRKLSKCYQILIWLKKVGNDVSDLQNFVNVALATAAGGEDAFTRDRLSDLRTVGAGFAPLIFNLELNADFNTLLRKCEPIWEALAHNPNLPELLESCNLQLDWYKSVKETHGSVEATSFGQLSNILTYGQYSVGSNGSSTFQSIHDIICLDLTEIDKPLPKKHYSLDDLQDLESRLVLITGSEDPRRDEVDLFLKILAFVRQIGEALICLQQFGRVKYIGWKLSFPMQGAESDTVGLQNLATYMEQELENWKDGVDEARNQFYHLNYYTAKQLLDLRSELGKLREDPDCLGIAPHALALLKSISPDVVVQLVSEVVQRFDLPESENLAEMKYDPTMSISFAHAAELESSDAETHFSIISTTPSADENIENLSGEKLAVYLRLTDYYDYPNEIAIEAVEKFDKMEQLEDATDWCENRLCDYEIDDSRAETHSSDEKGTQPDPTVQSEELLVPINSQNETYPSHDEATHPPERMLSLEINKEVFDICEDEEAEYNYLSLDELGRVLDLLSKMPQLQGPLRTQQRPFLKKAGLNTGVPNLIVTTPDNVLKTTLSLYLEDPHLPLPTPEEVLVCNDRTTAEEVILLWRRALDDPGYRRTFCLVHAEKLSYQVGDKAMHSLTELSKGKKGYRLIIICSSEDEAKSHIISKLHLYRKPYTSMHSDSKFKDYLNYHFSNKGSMQRRTGSQLFASDVDKDRLCVRVVSSRRSGMGKSLYVWRMAEKFSKMKSDGILVATIPVHGPDVYPDAIMTLFSEHLDNPHSTIFHLDVAPAVFSDVASILFCLLILRGICDSQGRVWRCHPSQLYVVEITFPQQQSGQLDCYTTSTLSLVSLLPAVQCISPREVLKHLKSGKSSSEDKVLMDQKEFQSASYQRVYQYLKRHNAGEDLDDFIFQSSIEDTTADCLDIICKYCGVQNPSWNEISHFVRFLNIQLHSSETSHFLKKTVTGLKTFVVKFLVRMSKDFATSSLYGEVLQEEGVSGESDCLKQLQIVERHQWEQRPHPYIFFNQDNATATFVGFTVTDNGDLLDPRTKGVLEKCIVEEALIPTMKMLKFNENYQLWSTEQLIPKLAGFMGIRLSQNPDESYVLTVDNFIKILAIQMRFRCGIPVIIMGETGCGKTRLIRYMCDMAAQHASGSKEPSPNMLILKVHGGTTEQVIVDKVCEAIKLAEDNRKKGFRPYTVLFFDEANTSDAIGLIKEIMCDRRFHGKPIPENIKFIAACNPYRQHDDEMIRKLESAGLGFYVKATKTRHRLGTIPLRQLVYRVLDLPPSMRSLVYDFGKLSGNTEVEYTKQIVKNHVQGKLKGDVIDAVADVLAFSQQYMRNRKDECSFVSLRDVERTMIVFKYFLGKMNVFAPQRDEMIAESEKEQRRITRALILALNVCYHARLHERDEFEREISQRFRKPLGLLDDKKFQNEINMCQEALLDSMVLGPNIAKNAALRENVFMMTVCIELRIPLFLVGKPGSSKSLAKTIVANSMQGQSSTHDLLKCLKQVHMFSYQCSKYSTPESVVEVFDVAKQFQEKQDTENYVSVVVLDEVGLAEDAPSLPLKALHPLLEDGTEGGDRGTEIIDREKRVAFIGISNWALDPAKMNRGVMVTRGDPSTAELVYSAKGICSNQPDDPVQSRLEPYFKPLARSYREICEKVNKDREFYGLRDFYSLIKMMYWLCKESGQHPNRQQLEHVIRRNFGGSETVNCMDIFSEYLPILKEKNENTHHTEGAEKLRYIAPDCSPVGLITAGLTCETTGKWENRYLLFLTENYAALQTLQHYLHGTVHTEHPSGQNYRGMEPFILFGSSFPKDKEYTQTCRNINQIKLCMETGRTVILLNLENLYESLYDVLNQYYLHHGGKRYVDLGLQTHRVKCQVHEHFRLILIAERQTVYDRFPTPLINRLEKHFVLSKTLLLPWQLQVLDDLEYWIQEFTTVSGQKHIKEQLFKPSDAFIGFQVDTPAAVVFEASNVLKKENAITHDDQEKVLTWSKHLLLRTASPDALVRLGHTFLSEEEQQRLHKIYFDEQHHSSIEDFLVHHLQQCEEGGILMQVTTHSHLLTSGEMDQLHTVLCDKLKPPECGPDLLFDMHSCLLQDFDTELDFTAKISAAFEANTDTLLIVQCDSGHLNGDLIACARYRIYDKRSKTSQDRYNSNTHVLFIIHLPRKAPGSSFVGFQGEPWVCCHVDDLRALDDDCLSLHRALYMPISDLFYNEDFVSHWETAVTIMGTDTQQIPVGSEVKHQCRRLCNCIQAAASRVHDSEENRERATERIELLLQLIPKPLPSDFPLNDCTFYGALVKHMLGLLKWKENDGNEDDNWARNEALSAKKLQHGGTFRNALARKIDEMLIPLFAEIIAFIDLNYNLNLVLNPDSDVYKLWIMMFRSNKLCNLKYSDIASGAREHIPGAGSLLSNSNFHCHLPFSWVIRSTITAEWSHGKSTAGNSDDTLHSELLSRVLQTDVGEFLETVESDSMEKLQEYYIHDFIKSVHKSTRTSPGLAEMEYELICMALSGICKEFLPDMSTSLTSRVVAVHIVYERVKQEIHWFGELVSYVPYILHVLKTKITTPSSQMNLHLHAVNEALSSPDLDITEPLKRGGKAIRDWLHRVYESQGAIEAILNLPSEDEVAVTARHRWKLLHALRTFVEHVLLKEEQLIPFARRLDMSLQKDSNLMKSSTFDKMRRLLKTFDNALSTKLKDAPERQQRVRESCTYFFMEIVANLCFGDTLPEDDVIEKLIEMVFPLPEGDSQKGDHFLAIDAVPALHLFLLRLLLQLEPAIKMLNYARIWKNSLQNLLEPLHQCAYDKSLQLPSLSQYYSMDETSVLPHLDSYLQNACHFQPLGATEYVQFVQCYEDGLYQVFSQMELEYQIIWAAILLHYGYDMCRSSKPFEEAGNPSLNSLLGVGRVRFALTMLADILYRRLLKPEGSAFTASIPFAAEVELLVKVANKVCTEEALNQDEVGAAAFFIKTLVRWYGYSYLVSAVRDHSLEWVLPPHMQLPNQEDKLVDPFVIYSPKYATLRDIIANAIYLKQFDELEKETEQLPSEDVVPLLLALYEKVTLARTSTSTGLSKQLIGEVEQKLKEFAGQCKVFSEHHLRGMARFLVSNSLPDPMNVETQSPLEKTLTGVVIHTVAVVACKHSFDILQLFVCLLENPYLLQEAYLPTMPDKIPHLSESELGDSLYQCPRGHRFLAKPVSHKKIGLTCTQCGAVVDRTKPLWNADTEISAQRGYTLGSAEKRAIPLPERGLSAVSCLVIRLLMHSVLLWSSCTNDDMFMPVTKLMKVNRNKITTTEFCWDHLVCDLNLLSKAVGRGIDEAAILVHLVLKSILANPPPVPDSMLKSAEARAIWETAFDDAYIQPVCKELAVKLHTVINRNEKKAHSKLFRFVYGETTGSIMSHLWAYRPRITLDHLTQVLPLKEMSDTYPILHSFLKEEPILRATQYLPQVLCLQQYLHDRFHHQLDATKANRTTFESFLRKLKQQEGEHTYSEYHELFTSIQVAWKLVREKLQEYARCRLMIEDKFLVPSMEDDTLLVYLIPTADGPGACTTALIKYLVFVHNKFIQYCRKVVCQREADMAAAAASTATAVTKKTSLTKGKAATRKQQAGAKKLTPTKLSERVQQSKITWKERHVALPRIQRCHLLDYEHQLIPVIMSHCHYSQSVIQDQEINCNMAALERHILHRFIHGKPVIVADIPQVTYRQKNVLAATTIADVRKKIPQKELPLQVQLDILQQLNEVHRLHETLEGVNIVLGFLASSGGKPETRLGDYLQDVLKMKHHPFSSKARDHCNLEHVVSLWRTLSLELAKQHTIAGHEPFESIPDDFLEDFVPHEEDQFRRILANLDVDQLLGVLYEFIETSIKNSQMADKDQILVDKLVEYIEQNRLLHIPRIEEDFPKKITLGQAVGVWKYIVMPPKEAEE